MDRTAFGLAQPGQDSRISNWQGSVSGVCQLFHNLPVVGQCRRSPQWVITGMALSLALVRLIQVRTLSGSRFVNGIGDLIGSFVLLNGLRVDRRPGGAGDNERRAAKEEFVDPVLGAVLGELLEIEDFAHTQTHGRDDHPEPGLVCFRGFVRSYLDPPGIRADGRNLLGLAPVAVLKLHARRVAAGVAAPLLLREAPLHLAGADDHEVAAPDLDILILGASVELVVRDTLAVLEPIDAPEPGNIEKHAAPGHPAL